MTYSVDRIEGDVVVLVDDAGHNVLISRSELPDSAGTGSILRLQGENYILDEAETEARRSYVLSLQEKLRRKKQ